MCADADTDTAYGYRIESLHVAIRFAVSVSVCRIRVRIRTHRIIPMRLHYNHFLPDAACRMPHPHAASVPMEY